MGSVQAVLPMTAGRVRGRPKPRRARHRQAIAAVELPKPARGRRRHRGGIALLVLRVTPEHLAAGAHPRHAASACRRGPGGRLGGVSRPGLAPERRLPLVVLVGARDRLGLLAAASGALDDRDLEVRRAVVATWPDGAALEAF